MHRLSPRDLWLLAFLTLSWGVNWPIMKLGVQHFPPMTFRVLCMVGGVATLAAMIRARGLPFAIPREHRAELVRIAVFNMMIWFMLSIYAVKLLSSGRAAILGYTLPIWTALWGLMLYGERPRPLLLAGVVSAGTGIALLLSSEVGHITGRPIGALMMLTAAFVWGYGTHVMRRRKLPTDIMVITFWCLLMSLVACSLLALAIERDQWVRWPDAVEWGSIAYNAIIIFSAAQLAWFHLATVLTPVTSTLSVMLIPVIGLFSGMALLGERPMWQDWVALVCILLAIGLALWPQKRPAGEAV